jgi:hypothetical protein
MALTQAEYCFAKLTLGSLIAIGMMLGAAATVASAEEPVPPADKWTVSFTPYGWLAFLNGDVTVRGRTVGVDINPIQVIEHLERVPWFSYAEARKGRLALYSDIFYANLGITEGVTLSRVAPEVGGSLGIAVGLDSEQAVIEAGAAYEIARWSSAGGLKGFSNAGIYTAIDVLAGARYWYQQMGINLAISDGVIIGDLIQSGNLAIARSGSVDWVDPVVGARLRHRFAPGEELVVRGDVGGFGAGSQFSWNALAAYSFDFAVRSGVTYSGMLGYRALYVDYEQGSGRNKYEFDVLQHGPIVGLTVGF